MNNPYPEFRIDERTKKEVIHHAHTYWQEGWDAREVVTKELYKALKAIRIQIFENHMNPTYQIEKIIKQALAEAEKK